MAPLMPFKSNLSQTTATKNKSSTRFGLVLKLFTSVLLISCVIALVSAIVPSDAAEESSLAGASQKGQVVVEPGAQPSSDELAVAEYLAGHGHRIRLLRRDPASTDPQPDAQLDDDEFPTEIKTVQNLTGADVDGGLANRIREAIRHAPSVVVDARKQVGLDSQSIDRAIRRAFGMANRDNKQVKRVRVLGPNGEDINRDYPEQTSTQ